MKTDTKTKIVQAAYELFAEKGYEETTLNEIIQATDLSKGAIYHHFRSKLDILETMTAIAEKRVKDFLNGLVTDTSLSAKEKITKIIDYQLYSGQQKQLIENRWLEKIPFAFIKEVRTIQSTIVPLVSSIIVQGVKNSEFECKDPLETAELIVFYFDVFLDPVLFTRSIQEIWKRIDFLQELLINNETNLFSDDDIYKIKRAYENL